MPIDVSVPESPGWWLQKGSMKLRQRYPRLQLLANYYLGSPPLPVVDGPVSNVFRRFQQQACTNFAELIVSSVRERCAVRDIRTATSGDQVDDVAWKLWRENGLDVEFSDVLENMLALGDAYMIVGLDEDGVVITGEDPRQVVTFHDPVRQSTIRAAVKMFRDADLGRDYAVLYLPGRMFVAYREAAPRPASAYYSRTIFSPSTFAWDPDQGGEEGIALPHDFVPVIRFRNRRGVGEFEPHIQLLDRINHMIYTRMVIALYQAFRQRAIKVDVSDAAVDENGDPVDAIPDDLLTSDPGSWIQLPKDAEIWESQQADMQGVISAIDADVKQLAAVTRRPMAIFAPDNQSAAGANLTSEGLVFATEDTQTRAGHALIDVMCLAFLTLGDEARADKAKITVGWAESQRYSITDKANATAQAKDVLPKRTIFREIWQQTPPQVDQIEAEASDELLLAAPFLPAPAASVANPA